MFYGLLRRICSFPFRWNVLFISGLCCSLTLVCCFFVWVSYLKKKVGYSEITQYDWIRTWVIFFLNDYSSLSYGIWSPSFWFINIYNCYSFLFSLFHTQWPALTLRIIFAWSLFVRCQDNLTSLFSVSVHVMNCFFPLIFHLYMTMCDVCFLETTNSWI